MAIDRRTFIGAVSAIGAVPAIGAVSAGVAGRALGGSVPERRISREGSDVKVDRVEVFAGRYPMTGYFKFFTGPHGSAGRAAVFVKITADDGTVGWGQSVPIAKWSYETLETTELVVREYFAPVLIGRDPADIAGAHAAMDGAIAPGFSTGMPISRAGIDIALHDLLGKVRRQSLAAMWGLPEGGEITLSWTVNAREIAGVEGIVGAGRERGYEHFNIKVAPDPEFDVALAREVRRLAPDCFLWADANGGYEPDAALSAAPRLADAGVDVFEAPIKPNRIAGYRALKAQAALPILMDEGVITPVELEEFHKIGMLDGVAMKPARCGGLASNHAQIEYCKKHRLMWLGSGLTDPDISFAATVGLYAAHRLARPAALNGPQFLTEDVLESPLEVRDGKVAAPTGPGLGIAVDEAKVRALCARSKPDR